VDAAVRPDAMLATVDARVDNVAQAKKLAEQAYAALEDSDPAKALDLADQSLKLRNTARTQLLRAQALQRLDRTDDALAAVEAARALADIPSIYEWRGKI